MGLVKHIRSIRGKFFVGFLKLNLFMVIDMRFYRCQGTCIPIMNSVIRNCKLPEFSAR